jgi:alkylhydroperoxidase/carboxymuconolactone decarboxylase family protein YurZ
MEEKMTRDEVLKDIEKTMGVVPTFMREIPATTLEYEWQLMKKMEFEPGTLTLQTRHLLGLAISTVTHSRNCAKYYLESARTAGVTTEEIRACLEYTKNVASFCLLASKVDSA